MRDAISFARALRCLLAVAWGLAVPSTAAGFSPFLVVPAPAVAEASPAYRYANMSDTEAFAELEQRGIPFTKLDAVPGVRAPIRLAGKLHGVLVHASLPPEQRPTSPFEILDARLALALDDFCALLEQHDIDEVVHYTMYRPNTSGGPPSSPPDAMQEARPRLATKRTGASPAASAPAKAPKGPKALEGGTSGGGSQRGMGEVKTVAKREGAAFRRHPLTWAPPGTRHPAGLAIDVGMLHKRDGRWLSVAQDFHGKRGARTCGEGAPAPDVPQAAELRALVCGAAAQSLFTYVLTPDYDAAHADHLHMEIKPGVKWFLYH